MSVRRAPLIAAPAALAHDWLSMVVNVADWCIAALDPRPDLAMPARRVTIPYAWWW